MRTTITTLSCNAKGCGMREHFATDDFPSGYMPAGWRSTMRRGKERKHWCSRHDAQAEREFRHIQAQEWI